jgi:TrmH family RNA methyltransferase
MLSKHNIELIRSLAQKKRREESGLFVAEGEKIVSDLLKTTLNLSQLYFTAEASDLFQDQSVLTKSAQITSKEMERISTFKNPSNLLAIFEIPTYQEADPVTFNGLNLILDGIQDPGNLGTMIRLADWFGIKNIFCSEDCVDNYNSKCVQSTMGAIARVKVHYTELSELLKKAAAKKFPVYGTYMEGENLYDADLASHAFIVMGSEGKGISSGLESFLTKKLSIPAFPRENKVPESLNVAVSAAIVCSEFRRRITY